MWISSRSLCKALLNKLKLRGVYYVLLVAVLTAEISARVSPPPSDLPSNQQVLAFLTESIDWYRHRTIEEQLATEPADLVFLEDNRPIASQIVQLSFDFARAEASLAATFHARNHNAVIASGSSPDLAHFVRLENNADLASRQAGAASLRELVEFVQATGGRQTDLVSSIEDLARTVPEVISLTAARSQIQSSCVPTGDR